MAKPNILRELAIVAAWTLAIIAMVYALGWCWVDIREGS